MNDMMDNPNFFGDKYNLIRLTAYVRPTMQRFRLQWGDYNAKGIHKSSFLKSYEEEYGCSVYDMNSEKGRYKIMSLLERKYGLYSVYHIVDQINIPIFS